MFIFLKEHIKCCIFKTSYILKYKTIRVSWSSGNVHHFSFFGTLYNYRIILNFYPFQEKSPSLICQDDRGNHPPDSIPASDKKITCFISKLLPMKKILVIIYDCFCITVVSIIWSFIIAMYVKLVRTI